MYRQIPFAAVNTPESTPPVSQAARHAGIPGLVAAVIIGFHALGCTVLAVFFPLMAARGARLSSFSHVMFSVFTGLFAVGLGFVARGLWQGMSWPRTATAVWLVLLLPVGWAMAQGGSLWFGLLILGSAVLGVVAVAAEARSL
jgi:hypothetical protein